MSINDFLDADLSPGISVILISIIVAAVIIWIKKKAVRAQNSTYPTVGFHVRIVEKTAVPGSLGKIAPVPVVFEKDNGERIQYYIPGNRVYNYVVGDHGMLYVQGSSFVGFERNATVNRAQPKNTSITTEDKQNLPTWKRIQMEKEHKT